VENAAPECMRRCLSSLLMSINSLTVCATYKFLFIVTCIQNLRCPSEALSVFFRRGGFRHVQHVRPNRGNTQTGRPRARERRTTARHFLACSVRASLLYGVLRHLFGAARHSVAYKYNMIFEFRKPYLKSGNSSKTAYSCNAKFMVSFCTLMPKNLCEAPHFYRTGPAGVSIPLYQHVFSGKTM